LAPLRLGGRNKDALRDAPIPHAAFHIPQVHRLTAVATCPAPLSSPSCRLGHEVVPLGASASWREIFRTPRMHCRWQYGMDPAPPGWVYEQGKTSFHEFFQPSGSCSARTSGVQVPQDRPEPQSAKQQRPSPHVTFRLRHRAAGEGCVESRGSTSNGSPETYE